MGNRFIVVFNRAKQVSFNLGLRTNQHGSGSLLDHLAAFCYAPFRSASSVMITTFGRHFNHRDTNHADY